MEISTTLLEFLIMLGGAAIAGLFVYHLQSRKDR
jgi:hypothetical protein